MNILVIGGTGVLSSAVVAEALKQGVEVTMINRGNRPIPQNVRLIKSDKNDTDFISKQLGSSYYTAVIDFLCYSDSATTKSFNFYKNYTKQYFFISSCAVYDTRLGKICSEDSPKVLPIWNYSINKWTSEQHLMKLAEETETKYTIIRPGVTYGETRIPYGISPKYGYHWTLAARILSGKPIIRWNGGVNRCNMTRVEDFAVGVVGLIGNPQAYNEAFNVCGDECPSFNDVLDAMSNYLGKPCVVFDMNSKDYAKEIPQRAGELLGGRSIDAIYSNAKIKTIVPSFQQTIFIKEGIHMTLDAYKTQNFQKGIDWIFDAETDYIIKKHCKKNQQNIAKYNLGFCDYLKNATRTNKKQYCEIYYKDALWMRIRNIFLHFLRK